MYLPLPSQAAWQHNLDATPSATVPGTSVAASSSIHTKNATYTQLIAATTYDSYGFWLLLCTSQSAGADTSMLFDLAIGASTAEVVILPNMMCGFRTAVNSGVVVQFIPLFIPKGSRVSGNLQALIASDTIDCTIWLNGGGSNLQGPIFTGCDAYGVDLTDSGGTTHTPGNTGAESTDANVGVTLTRNYGGVMLGLGFSGITMASNGYHWELTDGTTTMCEWYSGHTTSETIQGPFPATPFLIPLALGTQLQIQAEATGTADAHDVAFYCFY